jgi:hypothetical protein
VTPWWCGSWIAWAATLYTSWKPCGELTERGVRLVSTTDVRPHVEKARPQWDKGRRFWSGLSRQRRVILALAGLLVVVAVIAVPVAAFNYLFAAPDPNSPQALCDAVHDKGAQGGVEWYQGRQAAGDRSVQMMAIRDQAFALCPDIKSTLAQLPH